MKEYVSFLLILPLLMYVDVLFTPTPPPPEIKYGEFPFRLEYEINGQRIIIEDSVICEYKGIEIVTGLGKKLRKWEERLASGNPRVTLLKISDTQEIEYPPGYAEYYMGDPDSTGRFEHSFPNAWLYERNKDGYRHSFISAEELLAKYNIKLISWDYTEPITNNFVKKR